VSNALAYQAKGSTTGKILKTQVQATSDADTTRAEEMTVSSINAVQNVNAAPSVNAVALPAAVQSPASTWSAPLWADSGNSPVPTWDQCYKTFCSSNLQIFYKS